MRSVLLSVLKLIGVALFIWILLGIDRTGLITALGSSDPLLLLAGFFLTFGIFACKAARWRVLSDAVGARLSFAQSWRMTLIGLFLGLVTPAKLGEFGRAAYLRAHHVSGPLALALAVIDRIADAILIAALAVFAIGPLFGWEWTALIVLSGLTLIALLPFLWYGAILLARFVPLLRVLHPSSHKHRIIRIGWWTITAWITYFASTCLLARAVGITVDLPSLIAVLTITGIVALIPIAPSGLGTREAALVTLLVPLGVEAEKAVALGLIMFCTIILTALPGLWYWLLQRHTVTLNRPNSPRGVFIEGDVIDVQIK